MAEKLRKLVEVFSVGEEPKEKEDIKEIEESEPESKPEKNMELIHNKP